MFLGLGHGRTIAIPQPTRGEGRSVYALPMKPHSPACDRNQEPILAVLRQYFGDRRHVLELGSGTGQHAVHFAASLPWLQWQASDTAAALPRHQRLAREAGLANLPPPLTLQAVPDAGLQPTPSCPPMPTAAASMRCSAPTRCTSWAGRRCGALFSALPAITRPQALLAIYGPFKVDGQYTSESNRTFDGWLVREYPDGGQRDPEAVHARLRWRPVSPPSPTSPCPPATSACCGAAADRGRSHARRGAVAPPPAGGNQQQKAHHAGQREPGSAGACVVDPAAAARTCFAVAAVSSCRYQARACAGSRT